MEPILLQIKYQIENTVIDIKYDYFLCGTECYQYCAQMKISCDVIHCTSLKHSKTLHNYCIF